MTRTLLTLTLLAIHVATSPVSASPEAARALVDRAIAHYDAVGRDAAFADFNRKDGPFTAGDLYVWVLALHQTVLAHGANPALIGKDLSALRDVNGVQVTTSVLEAALADAQGGWSSYVWTNPVTRKLEPKRAWSKLHDGLVFVSGTYGSETE